MMSITLGFLVIALAAQYGSAAPQTEIPAECIPPKEDMDEIKTCCSMKEDLIEAIRPIDKCIALVKNLPSNLTGIDRRTLKPEGFDCFDDCILVQLNYMGPDKKIDDAKITASLKTAKWADVSLKVVEKCLPMASKNTGLCPSGADIFNGCFFRERYMNCPAELWKKSDACQRNLERLKKCPLSLPYHCSQANP